MYTRLVEPYNETVLTVALLAMGAYFSVLVVRGGARYLLFRRLEATALLTWRLPRPVLLPFLLALGLVAAALAVVNVSLHRPFHHVYGQGVMALYFLLLAPVLVRLPVGLYRDGVWTLEGFLPWAAIARMAFREAPDLVVLLLVRRGGAAPSHLPVPPAEYSTVRKLLEEKVRAHALTMDGAILGL